MHNLLSPGDGLNVRHLCRFADKGMVVCVHAAVTHGNSEAKHIAPLFNSLRLVRHMHKDGHYVSMSRVGAKGITVEEQTPFFPTYLFESANSPVESANSPGAGSLLKSHHNIIGSFTAFRSAVQNSEPVLCSNTRPVLGICRD